MQPLAPSAVRAAVVDDLDVVRSGLTLVLRRAGASIVEAHGSPGAAGAIDVDRCDLVLLGPHVAGRASELVLALRHRGFAGVVVQLVTVVARDEFVALLRNGIDAVAPFGASQDELADVLRRALDGERVFDGVALGAARTELTAADGTGLSARERQVLALLATRRTMADIAAELFLSVGTVKSHASNVYAKLGVRSRDEAVDRAFARRLLTAVV